MAELPHLILPRAEINMERRKRPGYGSSPKRDPATHAANVRVAVDGVLAHHAGAAGTGIDPALIVRVRTAGVVPDDEWERAGLTVLGNSDDQSVILFSSDAELQEFRRRLNQYEAAIPEGQKHPAYAALISAIEEFGVLRPEDRIGALLKSEGLTTLGSFHDEEEYRLDVELWDTGPQLYRAARVGEIARIVEARGGEVTDRYVGRNLTIFRLLATGNTVKWLLDLTDVCSVDRPPSPEDLTSELLDLTINDLPLIAPPPLNAPAIGVLDSGLTSAHPLLAAASGTVVGIPENLRADDVKGHGTRVAGIALYGDVRSCADGRLFEPSLRLHSAKVVNDEGKFDDTKLVASQMRDAITRLRQDGCRVFNLSLGDPKLVYADGRVGAWAAALDEIARELDIVIVVAAGNHRYEPPDGNPEGHLLNYPAYLISAAGRILEPASAAIPLTVGALAHSAAVPQHAVNNAGIQPVAGVNEPSPFTRCGPGVDGSVKPELCDSGGNFLFDGAAQDVRRYDEGAVVTLHHDYLTRLFAPGTGTSFAAPLVAHKAALLLGRFPDASANLIRALLVSGAAVPSASAQRLSSVGEEYISRVCGYGVADILRAATSDDNRVVMYAEGAIGLDHFFVYEVPIPAEYAATKGERSIQVTLAFDPPTRHTRMDYLGTRMSFRLARGLNLEQVVGHYRRRTNEDGPLPEMPGRHDCKLLPGPAQRDRGTLQRGTFVMNRNPSPEYGETYYLVVRCERKWAGDEDGPQRFAAVVEMSHQADVRLYERIRARVRVRVRLPV
jgi:hypothetical protein